MTHMLHGAGVYTYICPISITQFCRLKYTSTMEHMGDNSLVMGCFFNTFGDDGSLSRLV